MIVFRKVFDRIPADIAMDEAFVESLMLQRGMDSMPNDDTASRGERLTRLSRLRPQE
jgi:hypothetical protein